MLFQISSVAKKAKRLVAICLVFPPLALCARVEGDFHAPNLVNSIKLIEDVDARKALKITFINATPIVLLDLDEHRGVPFFLDTGTLKTYVHKDDAERLGIQTRDYQGVMMNDHEARSLLDVDTITLGGVSITVHGLRMIDVGKTNDANSEFYSGVIGWDILKYLDLKCDFSKGELFVGIEPSENLGLDQLPEDSLWRMCPVFSQRAEEGIHNMIIDTGAKLGWLTFLPKWRDLLPKKPRIFGQIALISHDGFGFGQCHLIVGGNPETSLPSGLDLSQVPLLAGGTHSGTLGLAPSILLGIGLLEDFKFTLSPNEPHFRILEQRANSGAELSEVIAESFALGDRYQAASLFCNESLIRRFISEGHFPRGGDLELCAPWCGTESLKLILENSVFSDEELYSAFDATCAAGNISNLELFLPVLEARNLTDSIGPIWVNAIRNGQVPVLEWLDEHRIPIPPLNPGSDDWVSIAAESGSASTVNYILDHKLSRKLEPVDITIFAAKSTPGDIEEFHKLADYAALREAIPASLYVACKYANWEAATKLMNEPGIADWASPNTGKTALMEAAFHGNAKTVAHLLDSGAEVNAMDNDGMPAFAYALKGAGDPEIVSLLAKGMAEVGTSQALWNSALNGVSKMGDTADLEALVNSGLELNAVPRPIRVLALLNATQRGSLGMVEMLNTNGALDWMEGDDTGKTALILALERRHLDLSEWIANQEGFPLERNRRIDTVIVALGVGGLTVARHFLGQLEPEDAAEISRLFEAAYQSGEVACLELLKDWCVNHDAVIPIRMLSELADGSGYRGVTEWVRQQRRAAQIEETVPQRAAK